MKIKPFAEFISEYKEQLEIGSIQKAYKGLIEYIMALKTHFTNKYPNGFTPGHLYCGYMDITYFTFTPDYLKNQKLKVAVVFEHEKMQFRVCLAGQNKQIQKKYWQIFKDNCWNKYYIPPTPQDVVIENVLVENSDFTNLDSLTEQIEAGTMSFIKDIMQVLT